MGQTDEKFKTEIIKQVSNLVKRNMSKTITSFNTKNDAINDGRNQKQFNEVEKYILNNLEDVVYDTADRMLSSFSAQMTYFAELNTDIAKSISECAKCFRNYNEKYPQDADEFFAQLSQVMLIENFTQDIRKNAQGSNVYESLTLMVLQAILVD